MKTLINICIVLFSSYSIADVTHFNLQNQILSIPFAVLDDTVFYENVEIRLNTITERFTVIDGTIIEELEDPDNATHYTSATRVLAIPFAALNGVEFYENVEITLDQDTGFFEVISGFEVGPPTQVFEFRLKLGESVKLFNADTLVYTNKQDDTRCPVLFVCTTPGFVQAGLQMPISAPGLTFFTLLNGIGGNDAGSTVVNQKYRFKLLQVNPYPGTFTVGNEIPEHEIVVEFQFVGSEL